PAGTVENPAPRTRAHPDSPGRTGWAPAVLLFLFATATSIAAPPGMVFIPGGEFLRGRSHALPDDNLKWWPTLMKDDRPVRTIRVDPFYLDQYEVTNAQYATFVTATKHRPPYNWPTGKIPEGKEQYPVADVDWSDATAYATWAGK